MENMKEVKTAHGFVLDGEPRFVDLTYRDQDTPVVTFDEEWQNTAHSTTNNTVVTDHFVQNTDYIKLRNVEIGYTLPKKFLSSLRISTARIYLNGQNLAVWDKMWLKDRDPESAGGAALAYPLQRVFNIGIHVEL